VITDQAMPGMTGLQLTEAIRRYWPAMPVILASGYAELASDPDPAIVKLAKPFQQEDLAGAIAASMKIAAGGTVIPFRSKRAEDPTGRNL